MGSNGGGSQSTGSSALGGAAQGAAAGAAIGGPWGAVIGGVAGAAGGIMSGNKAKAYEKQRQEAIALERYKREKYATDQQNLYGPIQQRLTQEAANPSPLDYGQNAAQVNQTTAGAERNLDAQMAARGMTGSGLQASGLQGLEMNRVGSLSSMFQQGLDARRKLGMGLLQNYNPLANQQFASGTFGAEQGFLGGQQDLYNNAAQQGMQGFGQGLGSLAQYFMQQRGGQQGMGGFGGSSDANAMGGFGAENTMQGQMGGLGYNPYPTRGAIGGDMGASGLMLGDTTGLSGIPGQ